MSHGYVSGVPVDSFSFSPSNSQLTVMIVGWIGYLVLLFLVDKKRINSFLWGFRDSIRSQLVTSHDSDDHAGPSGRDIEPSTSKESIAHQRLSREDTEIVLRSLGILDSSEEVELPAGQDADDLSHIFEEENYSLDEVKEAFDVFDKNRDGFINAEELQATLCTMGLKEGAEVEDCRRMIGMFDENGNGNGRIDFDEFVKFLEHSLS